MWPRAFLGGCLARLCFGNHENGIEIVELIKIPTWLAATTVDPTGMHVGQMKFRAVVRMTVDQKKLLM